MALSMSSYHDSAILAGIMTARLTLGASRRPSDAPAWPIPRILLVEHVPVSLICTLEWIIKSYRTTHLGPLPLLWSARRDLDFTGVSLILDRRTKGCSPFVAVGRWSSLQSRSPRGCKRIDGGRGEQAGGASRGHNAQAATRVPISTKYVTVLAIGAPSSFGGPRLSSGLLLLFCGTLTVLGCRHKHSTVHDCDPMACSDGSTRTVKKAQAQVQL